MPMERGRGGVRWMALVCRLVGLGIFVLAFFLPGVRGGVTGDNTATVYPGYECASLALSETMTLFGKAVHGTPPLPALMLTFSGWLNPLIGIVFLLSFWRKALVARRIVDVLVILCMAASWTFLSEETLTPLIGHFLWIAGALLILLPDVLPSRDARYGG